MEKEKLSNSLIESLESNSIEMINYFGEVTLDLFMEDGVAREIPILGSLCSLYKIGHTFRELNHLKKFYRFILAFNSGNVSEIERKKRIEKLKGNKQQCEIELEYILSVLEKYTEDDQSVLLANVYLSYLDNNIDFVQLRQHALIINQLLPGDVDILSRGTFKTENYYVSSSSHLRLVALGLMTELANIEEQTYELLSGKSEKHLALTGDYRQYELTQFGISFLKSIGLFSERTILSEKTIINRTKRHMDTISQIYF